MSKAVLAFFFLVAAADLWINQEHFNPPSMNYDRVRRMNNSTIWLGTWEYGRDYGCIGRESMGAEISRWGTAITPTYFLCANHLKPRVGLDLIFFRSNSITDSYARKVQQTWFLAGADLAIGRVDAAVETVAPIYRPPSESDYEGLTGLVYFGVAGSALTLPGYQKTGFRDSFDLRNTYSLDYTINLTSPEYAHGQYGDSGAPTWVLCTDPLGIDPDYRGPALIGLHWQPDTDMCPGPARADISVFLTGQGSPEKAVYFNPLLKGDVNGDGWKTNADKWFLATWISNGWPYCWVLDFDSDGDVDSADYDFYRSF